MGVHVFRDKAAWGALFCERLSNSPVLTGDQIVSRYLFFISPACRGGYYFLSPALRSEHEAFGTQCELLKLFSGGFEFLFLKRTTSARSPYKYLCDVRSNVFAPARLGLLRLGRLAFQLSNPLKE